MGREKFSSNMGVMMKVIVGWRFGWVQDIHIIVHILVLSRCTSLTHTFIAMFATNLECNVLPSNVNKSTLPLVMLINPYL